MRRVRNIILIVLAMVLTVISCSDYNIYTASKVLCKVGNKAFFTLQDAVDHVVSTGGKENNILVLADVYPGDANVDNKGVVVPSDYDGDIIFDFCNHKFFFDDKIAQAFVFDGGKNIAIKNGSINTTKAAIKATNVNIIVENCTISALKDVFHMVNGTATISKGGSVNGDFKLEGTSNFSMKGGCLKIDSMTLSNDATILFYEGEVFIKHELEDLVDKAINNVPVEERGEVTIKINHGTGEFFQEKIATCFAPGWIEHYKCQICGKAFKDNLLTQELTDEELILPQLEHLIAFFPAKVASCTESGWIEHYKCNRCSTYFEDKEGTIFLDEHMVIKPALGHQKDVVLGQNDPNEHWFHCNVDNVDFGYEKHSYTPWEIFEDGYMRTCTVCGRIETTKEEHRWIKVDRVEPTCTTDGNIEYWYCEIHPDEYTSDAEHHNKITKEETILSKLGHEPFKWGSDKDDHWQFCPRCKEEMPGTRGKHDYEICYDYDQSNRNLSITSKCTVCNHEEIDKLDTPTGAFDITTSSGGISATRKNATSWIISLSDEMKRQYHSCKWTDEKNNPINIEGKDSFSITYVNGTQGHYVIMCHLYDVLGKEQEICFVQISI